MEVLQSHMSYPKVVVLVGFFPSENKDLSPTRMQPSAEELSLYPKRLTDPMKHLQNFTKGQKQSYISLLMFSDTKALFKMKNVPT